MESNSKDKDILFIVRRFIAGIMNQSVTSIYLLMAGQRKYYYDTVYNTKRWRKLRLVHINSHPDNALCLCCLHGHRYCCSGMTKTEGVRVLGYGQKMITPMEIVDHILALSNGGDAWDLDNLRSYGLRCGCHSRKTKRIDTMDRKKMHIDVTHEELEDFDL